MISVFNVPVLHNTSNISSPDDIVSIVLNSPWESLVGHHLVVIGIMISSLSGGTIWFSEDNSSISSFILIDNKIIVSSVDNRPVSVVEKPFLIFITNLEVLDSESSNSINRNGGKNEIGVSGSLFVVRSKVETFVWLKWSWLWWGINTCWYSWNW